MRIQYLSDVHFELHADAGADFVASLDPSGIDVLVVAGDMAVGPGIAGALDRFCARYAQASVVYVHGNHEYYGATRAEVVAITRQAAERNKNLHWLDVDAVELPPTGRRFIGAPLWFAPPANERLKAGMSDFHQIKDLEQWVYDENRRALAFFERHLREGDVVVTHHLPTHWCVARRWKASPMNAFFVCELENLIRARRPALWIHGHTHDSVDLELGKTRLVCNPFGYVRHELNREFDDKAVIELP